MRPNLLWKFLLCFIPLAIACNNTPPPANDYNTHYAARMELFKAEVPQLHATILLGNSITEGADWQELLPSRKLINRGIAGDQTQGVMNRMFEVGRLKPRAVVLEIGINDLAAGATVDSTFTNVMHIVADLKDFSSRPTVYVMSLLPVNKKFPQFPRYQIPDKIIELNQKLEAAATNFGFQFINMHKEMVDPQGAFREDLTNDGLHPDTDGYRIMARVLGKTLKE